MGARGKNFYHDLACRYGFQEAADHVQDLYLAGQKEEAARAIPDELVDATSLCGPKHRIAERLELWKASPITTLNMTTFDPATVRVMAELVMGADAGKPDRTISIPSGSTPAEGRESAPPAGPTPASIFERMAQRVVDNPGLATKVNASFQFNLTGDQSSNWVINMKNAAEVRQGEMEGADCTITISDADFVALATGKLNPMTAFSSGKLKVQGNPMVAMKLQSLF
jgi:putative sterol carrier protein